MKILHCAITGNRKRKMPYCESTCEHERLERLLRAEIIRLIRAGVSEFYAGGQNGIDELAALLVLSIRDEIWTTARLHLVLPYEGIERSFGQLQRDNFEWIRDRADSVTCLNEVYRPGCYRERNRYMIDRSDFIIVVGEGYPRSGTVMVLNMARRKGISTILVDPVTYRVTYGSSGEYVKSGNDPSR